MFENRTSVVFLSGNEESMAYGSQFLSEHRSLVDFQIGNEHHMAYGAHFLFDTRPMIDLQIGNERYRGLFRYLRHWSIFPF